MRFVIIGNAINNTEIKWATLKSSTDIKMYAKKIIPCEIFPKIHSIVSGYQT